jgi:hypothetical protein
MKYKHPNSLEFNWAKNYKPKDAIGLYFLKSKVVNLPLNVVSKTGNPHLEDCSQEALMTQFELGLKFDITPLEGIENSSPHFPYQPPFTKR